jgi:mRNA-degrading endonuclease RelE of RelBE toxin-antitoxin system
MPLVGFAFTAVALKYLARLPPKMRRQVTRKARALQHDPHPQGSKKLHDEFTATGEPIYRERSGDYRILYIDRPSPREVIVLDIDDRKDVYR